MLRPSAPNTTLRRRIITSTDENQTDIQSNVPFHTAKRLGPNPVGHVMRGTPMTPCLHRSLFKKTLGDGGSGGSGGSIIDTPTKPSSVILTTPSLAPSSTIRRFPATTSKPRPITVGPTPVRRLNLTHSAFSKPQVGGPTPSRVSKPSLLASNRTPVPSSSFSLTLDSEKATFGSDGPTTFKHPSSNIDPTNKPSKELSTHILGKKQRGQNRLTAMGCPVRENVFGQLTLLIPDDTYPGVERPTGEDIEIEYCPNSNKGLADFSDDCDDFLLYPIQVDLVPMPRFDFEPPPHPGEQSSSDDEKNKSRTRSSLSPIVTKMGLVAPKGPMRAMQVVDMDYDRTAWSLEEGSSDDGDDYKGRLRSARRMIITEEDNAGQLIFE